MGPIPGPTARHVLGLRVGLSTSFRVLSSSCQLSRCMPIYTPGTGYDRRFMKTIFPSDIPTSVILTSIKHMHTHMETQRLITNCQGALRSVWASKSCLSIQIQSHMLTVDRVEDKQKPETILPESSGSTGTPKPASVLPPLTCFPIKDSPTTFQSRALCARLRQAIAQESHCQQANPQ